MSVGKRLREEREKLEMSQEAMAKMAGISRVSQSNYERDERSPDNEYWQTLYKIGVDILYVITGKREKRKN
jgi:transcriptional regulator with XRE-family HTH domain